MKTRSRAGVLLAAGLSIAVATTPQAATIDGWNTTNVAVGATPADGVTGYSTVYDRAEGDAGAVTNGRIAFTPPEAVTPGIKVENVPYEGSGQPPKQALAGCLMTSNPGATCTSAFQSGKRIKQQMTGFGPVDLVFDVSSGDDSVYQVFHRLINVTSKSLAGFAIELGFGVGSEFVQATASDGLTFSSVFRAAGGATGASTQFPFGLFGDAASNDNFSLDGFFAPERAGFDVQLTDTKLVSTGLFGPYGSLFTSWLSQDAVPLGALWDYEDGADPLVMGWLNADGKWELRRDFDGNGKDISNVVSLTGGDVKIFDTFAELEGYLGLGNVLFEDVIEDLANLNVNFAIALGDMNNAQSFTLRTTVFEATTAAVPLPAGAPLLLGGLALLGAAGARRRRKAT